MLNPIASIEQYVGPTKSRYKEMLTIANSLSDKYHSLSGMETEVSTISPSHSRIIVRLTPGGIKIQSVISKLQDPAIILYISFNGSLSSNETIDDYIKANHICQAVQYLEEKLDIDWHVLPPRPSIWPGIPPLRQPPVTP